MAVQCPLICKKKICIILKQCGGTQGKNYFGTKCFEWNYQWGYTGTKKVKNSSFSPLHSTN